MFPDNFGEGQKETKTRLIETPLSAGKWNSTHVVTWSAENEKIERKMFVSSGEGNVRI